MANGIRNIIDFDELSQIRQIPGLNRYSFHNAIIRPDKGHIEIYQHLPVQWDGFNTVPRFSLISDFRGRLEKFRVNERPNLFSPEFWSDVSSRFLRPQVIPNEPPSIHGFLLGRASFITFEGEYIEITDGRQFLLLADIEDPAFSVFIDYKIESQQVIIDMLQIMTLFYIE